jgi:hypothetical protein
MALGQNRSEGGTKALSAHTSGAGKFDFVTFDLVGC